MANNAQATQSNAPPSNLFSFYDYLRGRGLTRTTGYRYRRQGLLVVVNIFGKLYITGDEIRRFEERAISGEFRLDTRKANNSIHEK